MTIAQSGKRKERKNRGERLESLTSGINGTDKETGRIKHPDRWDQDESVFLRQHLRWKRRRSALRQNRGEAEELWDRFDRAREQLSALRQRSVVYGKPEVTLLISTTSFRLGGISFWIVLSL